MKYSDYRKTLSQDQEYQKAKKELRYAFALGDAVLKARLEKGWSQSELARHTGTKQANISRIEAGLSNPTLYLIQKLCDALDLDLRFQPFEQAYQPIIRVVERSRTISVTQFIPTKILPEGYTNYYSESLAKDDTKVEGYHK